MGSCSFLRDVEREVFLPVCRQISWTQLTSMKLGNLTRSSVHQASANHQPWPA